MNEIVLISVLVLGGIGIVSALVLYATAKKFKVDENPKIGEVEELLPGANCGGCGKNGCHDFAVACASATSLEGLNCPSSSEETMCKIAEVLGLNNVQTEKKVAVIRCNGTCENRPKTSVYDGPQSCKILNSIYVGSTDCAYGCLGCGDCAEHCQFGGITMNKETGLPEINYDICVGCGSCVQACPRGIIELRNKGPRGMRVYVGCSNKDKGAIAMKICKVACIGCGKCAKECTHDAITVKDNHAYIDYEKCKLCRKCVEVCPMHSILAVNFPVKKQPAATAEQKN